MKTKRVRLTWFVMRCLCMFIVLSTAGPSPAWEAPKYIPVGTFQVESMGYISATALHSVAQDATGVRFPATPAATSIERATLLKRSNVKMSWLIAPEIWFLLEGKADFEKWGPQSMRVVWHLGNEYVGLLTRADSGIKTVHDLAGKRVADYPNYPLMEAEMNAALAYANLTWKDVKRTPVGGFANGIRAVIDGAADTAFASVLVSLAYDLEASAHGIYWIPFPNETAEDKAAWARFHKYLGSYFPGKATTGPGIPPGGADVWTGNYHVVCYDWIDEDLVYWYAKQVHELYGKYKDKHGLLKRSTFDHALDYRLWFCPLHNGTVKYYKDIGVWTAEMQKKQEEMLKKYPQAATK